MEKISPDLETKYKPFRSIIFMSITSFLVAGFDVSISFLALPLIKNDLNLNTVQTSWFTAIQQIAKISFGIPLAQIGVKIGAVNSLILYSLLQSILYFSMAFLRVFWGLLVIRFMQGAIAAGTFINNNFLIQNVAPPDKRKLYSRYQLLTVAICNSIANIIGGVIMDYCGWQYVYMVSAISAALRLVSLLFFQNTKQTSSRFDILGSILLITVLSLFCGGITFLSQENYVAGGGMMGGSAAALICLIIQQKYSEQKIIDVSLLGNKIGNIMSLSGVLFYTNIAENLLIPFLAQQEFSQNPSIILGIQNCIKTFLSAGTSLFFIFFGSKCKLEGMKMLFYLQLFQIIMMIGEAFSVNNYYVFITLFLLKNILYASLTQIITPTVQSQIVVQNVGKVSAIQATINNLTSTISQTISSAIIQFKNSAETINNAVFINYMILVCVSSISLLFFINTFSCKRKHDATQECNTKCQTDELLTKETVENTNSDDEKRPLNEQKFQEDNQEAKSSDLGYV